MGLIEGVEGPSPDMVGSTDDGQLTLPDQDGLSGQVEGHEGGRAGRLHSNGGTPGIEEVRYPESRGLWDGLARIPSAHGSCRVSLAHVLIRWKEVLVVVAPRGGVHGRLVGADHFEGYPRILQGVHDPLEKEALLRVHEEGLRLAHLHTVSVWLPLSYPEETVVEFVDTWKQISL